ncbi:MAG: TolC family protein [Pirellulales bacterium]
MKALALTMLSILAVGCTSSGRKSTQVAISPTPVAAMKPAPASIEAVKVVAYEQAADSGEILTQPPSVATAEPESLPPVEPDGITIENLQQMALANNPAVAQAAARVDALQGKWFQAGLPPNPSAGYAANEIGDEGHGGQQGGFVGQEYITGGKLRLDRAIVTQEIQRAQLQLHATQLRVTTDVRKASYAALVAQRRVELASELLRFSGEAVQASKELQEAEEIPRAGLLQTEVEQQNAAILQQTARNELTAAWRQLSATVGVELPVQQLVGDATRLPEMLDWDEQLARVTASSPELAAAMAEIVQRQAALRRARVEPIPNLTTQVSVQFDDATNDTIASVQAGVPLPLWNRNQGGIRQAQAEAAEATRNAARIELDLKRRLAEAYQSYSTARMQAQTYATTILPKAQQTLELVQRGYRLGEVGYLDLLNAQRTFSQTNLAYLDALAVLWANRTEIDGLLLTGSLAAPPQ